jgi:hypothetical protein
MLVLFVKALFLIFSNLDWTVCRETIKHIMDAISKLFSHNCGLRKSIIDLILIYQEESQRNINQYFNWIFQEEMHHNPPSYKCTLSYLKLMTKIFKIDYPYMCLQNEHQVNLQTSFLSEMLNLNFSQLFNTVLQIQFGSITDFSKFNIRLLKLATILLKKFDCGNSISKIEVAQKNPRFDAFLQMISKAMNSTKFILLISILEI